MKQTHELDECQRYQNRKLVPDDQEAAADFPLKGFRDEATNSVEILRRLREHGLIIPVNPQDPGSQHKFLITEAGKKLLIDLGL